MRKPVSYTHLDVYKRQGYDNLVVNKKEGTDTPVISELPIIANDSSTRVERHYVRIKKYQRKGALGPSLSPLYTISSLLLFPAMYILESSYIHLVI